MCVKRAEGGAVIRLEELHGPVIGALEGLTYREGCIGLCKDDVMLMYTDGVTEAMDLDRNLFSEQRLVDWFESCEETTVDNIVHGVMEQVKRFEDGADQADDITVMTVSFNGQTDDKELRALELTVTNRAENIQTVIEQFNTFAKDNAIQRR